MVTWLLLLECHHCGVKLNMLAPDSHDQQIFPAKKCHKEKRKAGVLKNVVMTVSGKRNLCKNEAGNKMIQSNTLKV